MVVITKIQKKEGKEKRIGGKLARQNEFLLW